ncbi:GH32 C-terminal domain-containing protein [Deinococcus sp.]|uniref:GH32 C-terminal domain-containing protein n=1 Tax=Deinococcus sp. TaxID=47478 RepID=UPI00286985AD|nr:GH32 C-terminal domain-containing protein [Deinococcus sp.]
MALRGPRQEVEVPPGQSLDLTPSVPRSGHVAVTLTSEAGVEATLRVGGGLLTLDRPGHAEVPGFGGQHAAPRPGTAEIDLRIIFHTCSLEVFACGGRMSLTDLLLPASPITGVSLDGAFTGDLWTLRPCRPGWNDVDSAQTVGR